MAPAKTTTAWQGQHLVVVVEENGWEYATRIVRRPAVAIVAVTAERHIVLVEQDRPPVGRRVIELPAGLTGDVVGAEHERLAEAAQRELLEETGYEAARWTELTTGFSSPGLTDETVVLFLAEDLTKRGTGGGVDREQITLHEVPIDEVLDWLTQQDAMTDLKTLAGLYAARAHFDTQAK